MHWSVKGVHDYQTIPLNSNVKSIIEGEKIATERAKKLMKNAEFSGVVISFNSIDDLKNCFAEIRYSYFAENNEFFGNKDLRCYVTIDTNKQAITGFDAYGGNHLPGDFPLDMSKWKIDIKDLYKIISQKAPDYIKNKNPQSEILIRACIDRWAVLDVLPSEPGYHQEEITIINPNEDIE